MVKRKSSNLDQHHHSQNSYFLFWASLLLGIMATSFMAWGRFNAFKTNVNSVFGYQDGLPYSNGVAQYNTMIAFTGLMTLTFSSFSNRNFRYSPTLLHSIGLIFFLNPLPAQAQLAAPYTLDLTTTQLGVTTFINVGGASAAGSATSVSYAPDINGDNIPEILIGAYTASPQERTAAGSTYLIWGNKTLPNIVDLATWNTSNLGVRFDGTKAQEQSGFAISSVPDINGDNIPEILIGSPQASPQGKTGAGSTYLIWGNKTPPNVVDLATWVNFNIGVRFDGAMVGDASGIALCSSPDINGDNIPEILIGAHWAFPQGRVQAGSSYLIWGNKTLPNIVDLADWSISNLGVRFDGAERDDYSGYAVSCTPDSNGDNIPEILIGAHNAHPQGKSVTGSTYLIWGNKTLPNIVDLAAWNISNLGVRFDGAQDYDSSGWALSSSPDINGDNLSEILIGAYGASPQGRGSAGTTYLIWGNKTFPNIVDLTAWNISNLGVRFDGAISGDYSGCALSNMPDLNGDRLPEILIGAYFASPKSRNAAGSSYLIWGSKTLPNIVNLATLATLNIGVKFDGTTRSGYSGASISSALDMSGDGRPEILVGVAAGSKAYLISSQTLGFPGSPSISSGGTSTSTTMVKTSSTSKALPLTSTTSKATTLTTKAPTLTTLSLTSDTLTIPTPTAISSPTSTINMISATTSDPAANTFISSQNSDITSTANSVFTSTTSTISGTTNNMSSHSLSSGQSNNTTPAINATLSQTPSSITAHIENSNSTNYATIGGAVGGAAVGVLLTALGVYACRKKRNKSANDPAKSPDSPYAIISVAHSADGATPNSHYSNIPSAKSTAEIYAENNEQWISMPEYQQMHDQKNAAEKKETNNQYGNIAAANSADHYSDRLPPVAAATSEHYLSIDHLSRENELHSTMEEEKQHKKDGNVVPANAAAGYSHTAPTAAGANSIAYIALGAAGVVCQ